MVPSHFEERGWRFRIEEVSWGQWVVEGVDPWGRKVSRSGSDADALLAACRKDAEDIDAAVARKAIRP
jgi:hypothetical protein